MSTSAYSSKPNTGRPLAPVSQSTQNAESFNYYQPASCEGVFQYAHQQMQNTSPTPQESAPAGLPNQSSNGLSPSAMPHMPNPMHTQLQMEAMMRGYDQMMMEFQAMQFGGMPFDHQQYNFMYEQMMYGSNGSGMYPPAMPPMNHRFGQNNHMGMRGLNAPSPMGHHGNTTPHVAATEAHQTSAPCACYHCAQAANFSTPNKGAAPTQKAFEKDNTPESEFRPTDNMASPEEKDNLAAVDPAIITATPQRRGRGKRGGKPVGNSPGGNSGNNSHTSAPQFNSIPPVKKDGPAILLTLKTHAGARKCMCYFQVKEGDHIIFDGDRGFDLGLVSKVERDPAQFPPPNPKRQDAHIPDARCLATEDEVKEWATEMIAMEETATAACNDCVQRLDLPLYIVRSSYQFDRKKLTFFYENLSQSGGRVDFRTLLHEMYGAFRCRIWMERADQHPSVLPTSPTSIEGPQFGKQQE